MHFFLMIKGIHKECVQYCLITNFLILISVVIIFQSSRSDEAEKLNFEVLPQQPVSPEVNY